MKRWYRRIFLCILASYVLLGVVWFLVSQLLFAGGSPYPASLSFAEKMEAFLVVGLMVGVLSALLWWGARVFVTKREKLEEREQLSEKIIETAEEGIWVLDAHGETVFANRKLSEMLGYALEDILHRPVMDFVQEDWETAARKALDARRAGKKSSHELKFKRADGSGLWGLVSGTPMYDANGDYAGSFAMVTDITERKETQKSLEKERQYLSDILHSIRDGICILDLDQNVVRVNNALEEWYTEAMPLVGKKCYEAFQGRKVECENCPTRQTIETGEPASATIPYSGPSKEIEGWAYLYSFPLFDSESGELRGVIEYVRDITEQRHAEQALRESQQRFRAFMDQVPASVFMKDSDGQTIYVNSYMKNTHGAEDWTGKGTDEVLPDDVAETMVADDRAALEAGQIVVEEEVPDKHGRMRVYETHKFSMPGPDGEPILGGFALDITRRKRTQDALRSSEIRYRTLFETANDAILLMDGNRFVDCNQRALDVFGCERGQIIGATPYEQFSPEFQLDGEASPEKARSLIQAALGGEPQSFEWQHLRQDGEPFHAEVSLTRMDLEGEVLLQAIVRDVSDRKRARDRLQQSREELRALAAKLAETEEAERRRLSRELHDRVGSTLSGLSMQLTHTKRKLSSGDSSEVRSGLDEAVSLVEDLADQVRDVTSDLRPSILDDYGLFAALKWYVGRFTDRTGISAVVEGQEPAPRLPTGTETALFRIAQEALTNVAKHSGAEGAVVSVDHNGDYVEMRVEDDGSGFSEQAQDQPEDGTGWGLITMRERAYAVRGELNVESEVGGGTTISVKVER